MKKQILSVLFAICMVLPAINVLGQESTQLIGKVTDDSESIVGAYVVATHLESGKEYGAVTDLDGNFSIKNLKTGAYNVVFSFMGYTTTSKEIKVNSGNNELEEIVLSSSDIGIAEISVLASIAVDRKTPVAVSTISAKQMQYELGSQEFPEILNNTPGVYATKSGGGVGDARINLRGFAQNNIAVLVNGVPVNDMENGWVYWSNWAGLSDASRTMQVQRGLGASKLAINSVGGTINIITKTTDVKKGGFVEQSITDYGNMKTKIGLSTGLMENGFAVSFVGSRTKGPGYVDNTWVDAWSYFLSVNKDFGTAHKLSFTAVGAPQQHGQRDNFSGNMLSQEEYDQYGGKYNRNWGAVDGRIINQRVNYYHKPQLALNHYWTINDKAVLSTAGYFSFGKGGGSGPLGGFYDGFYYKYNPKSTPLGQYDYEDVVRVNQGYQSNYYIDDDTRMNFTQAQIDNGQNLINSDSSMYSGSKYILRNSVNSHLWTGILSSLNWDLSEDLKLVSGVDARYYKGIHYREVRDLLGGEYYNDEMNANAHVGDKIDYQYDGIVKYGGLFAQLEYSAGPLSMFLAGTGSNTRYQRIGHYNVDPTEAKESEEVSLVGYNTKAGANFNINDQNNVFVNGGYYSTVPKFNFVFIDDRSSGKTSANHDNEIVKAAELGYGFKNSFVGFKLNAYYTQWTNRWLSGEYRAANNEDYFVTFNGVEQTHTGIEAEVYTKLWSIVDLGVFGSLGDWKYTKDSEIDLIDETTGQIVETQSTYLKDLKIADAPQKQIGANLNIRLTSKIDLGATWKFNGDLYSNFSPENRTDETDTEQSYKIPDYDVLDLRAGYSFKIADMDSYFSIMCFNALDKEYIAEGFDNAMRNANGEYLHGKDNFKGFWGFGRNFYFSFRVNF